MSATGGLAPSAAHAQLAEIVRRLADVLHPTTIHLFGSRARGDARADSDYDLLVVVDELREGGPTMEQQASAALWGIPAPVDVVVMSRERFDWLRTAAASLPATVEREGRVMYGA